MSVLFLGTFFSWASLREVNREIWRHPVLIINDSVMTPVLVEEVSRDTCEIEASLHPRCSAGQ